MNDWLGELFAPENRRDQTVRMLVSSQQQPTRTSERERAEKRLKDAEAKLRGFQAAIESGIDPAALVEVTNQAHAERVAARAELDNAPVPDSVTDAEVYAMIDALGDVGSALTQQRPDRLAELYDELRLDIRYDDEKQTIDVMAAPRVNSACVRGGHRPDCAAYLRNGGMHVSQRSRWVVLVIGE